MRLLQWLAWLGRQDSNLGIAESKSNDFRLFINGHSENSGECDVNPFNGLSDISEWLAKRAYEIAPPEGFHSFRKRHRYHWPGR
jgi:hypothetical protein